LLGFGDTALRSRGRWAVASLLLDRTAKTGFSLRRYLSQLRSLIRRTGPDIVHSNALKFHLLTGMLGMRVPVVWHLRDYLSEPSRDAACPGALAPAGGGGHRHFRIRQPATPGGILGARPVATVYNAIDTDDVRARTLARGGGSMNGRTVHGRRGKHSAWPGGGLARWKGQDTFVQAAVRVAARLPARRSSLLRGRRSHSIRPRDSQWSTAELAALEASW